MTLTIALTKDQEEQLQKIAQRKGVTVEAFAQAAVVQSIGGSRVQIDDLIKEIVRDNHELYKRLAK